MRGRIRFLWQATWGLLAASWLLALTIITNGYSWPKSLLTALAGVTAWVAVFHRILASERRTETRETARYSKTQSGLYVRGRQEPPKEKVAPWTEVLELQRDEPPKRKGRLKRHYERRKQSYDRIVVFTSFVAATVALVQFALFIYGEHKLYAYQTAAPGTDLYARPEPGQKVVRHLKSGENIAMKCILLDDSGHTWLQTKDGTWGKAAGFVRDPHQYERAPNCMVLP